MKLLDAEFRSLRPEQQLTLALYAKLDKPPRVSTAVWECRFNTLFPDYKLDDLLATGRRSRLECRALGTLMHARAASVHFLSRLPTSAVQQREPFSAVGAALFKNELGLFPTGHRHQLHDYGLLFGAIQSFLYLRQQPLTRK